MALLREDLTTASAGHVGDSNQVHSRLNRQWYDVRTDFDATGDGTTDDTTAVQNALNAANAAGGGVVYFPDGDYSCHDLTTYANVVLLGQSWKAIIRQRQTSPNTWLISVNPGSGGTTNPDDNAKNVTFRNLTFRGYVDVDVTFNQQRHLLNLNAVSDVLVEGCQFVGWHGDAIYLGSSNTGGVERHNQRVRILNNTFDGLTKNNRNCVTIIDGDDVLIQGNTFRRNTRSDMPGCIDIEPNPGNTFAIIRNVRILGNVAHDHHQNFVQMLLPDGTYTIQPSNIVIADNIDDPTTSSQNANFVFLSQNRTATDTSPRNDITIIGNQYRNGARPWYIQAGMVGVRIQGNTFRSVWGSAYYSFWSIGTRFVDVVDNDFVECAHGESGGYVLRVMFAHHCSIVNNRFVNCGNSGTSAGVIVRFTSGTLDGVSSDIDFISNLITGTRTVSISSLASHTTTAASNRRRPYRENGLAFDTNHFGTLV